MYPTKIGTFETAEEAILALENAIVTPKEEPKTKLLFVLTMPKAGSWNGKWSGEGSVHVIAHELKKHPSCQEGHYSYSWNDGWMANIEVRLATTKEARSLVRQSKGFCGYEWMIQSILANGEIILK